MATCSHVIRCALLVSPLLALAAGPGLAQPREPGPALSFPGECATPDRATRELLFGFPFDPSDCSATSTNPSPEYDPGVLYEIPVVVHVIMDDSCTQGVVPDERIHSQIEILDEDYLALPGTNGENGIDTQIRFVLASEDPDGNPTTGITRDCNTTWYNDDGEYWNELAWDPHNYLNLYTNTAGGAGGYVPFLPADGGGDQVGEPYDRVVVNHLGFGRWEGPVPEHNDGRLATHEIGHYLGLLHPFIPIGECGAAEPPGCYEEGDLICDTPVTQIPNEGCPKGAMSCDSPDPITNHMNYTDDLCKEEFTLEQSRRLRCTLQFYRPELYDVVEGLPVLTFDPASLAFGDVEVGSDSPPQTVTLTNSGDADATGLALALTGDAFTADTGACGPVLEPAASCAITVTFSPLVAGPAEGELSATSDQGASAVAELTGNGVEGPEPTAACVWDTTLGNPGGSLNALGLWNDVVYVGGSPFTPFNGVDNGVAVVDLATGTTSPLGTTELTDGFVGALVPYDDGDGERLYIVGAFNGIVFDGTELPDSRGVVAWDGSTTTTLPGSPFAEPLVFAQAATVYDGRLVIGGAGGAVDPPQKPVLTLWDGTEWTTFREEFTGLVAPVILAVEEFQGDLYFGGRFATIEYPSGNVVESMNVMGFDGESFFSVGGGVERDTSPVSQVLALETFDDGSGEALYIGGRFDTSVDGEPMFAVAKWDGSELTAVGNGFPMPSEVRGFEVYDNGGGPALYAVGNFTEDTAGQPIQRIAKLENGEWVEVAGGAGENPNRALALPDGSLGFAGSFTTVGDEGTPGSGPASGFAQVSCLANLSISPTSHDFGTLEPDDTASALFTLSNQTDADITLGVAATGGDAEFSIGDTDACSGTVLVGGASCQVEVVFDPAGAIGSFSGSLQMPSDANSVLATLTGSTEEVEPEGPIADVSPGAFSFELPQGGGDSDTLSIGNLGEADLTWSLEEAEASFAAAGIPPGMPYTYDLAWTPELHAPVGASRATRAAEAAGAPLRGALHLGPRASARPAGRGSVARRTFGRHGGRPLQAEPRVLPAPQPAAVGSFTEGFDDITQLPGAGWAMINNSEPVGPTSWFQGNDSIFPAHEGAPDAYIAANYESTAGVGTISNWLITPEVTIVNGTELCFWTRKSELFEEFLDRLEVRMSVEGDSIDVGDTAESVGAFVTLLLTIEPDLELPNEYPEEWTQYCLTVRERSREPVTGRFALHYWVTDSGPEGTNGDYIGIDTVSVTQPGEPPPGGCDDPVDVPWLAADPTSGTTAPGASEPVTVTVDTGDLEVGEYTAQLCVTTNDPAAPLIAVPVSLAVTEGGLGELEVTTLMPEGDDVPGVGLMTRVADLAVNGAGSRIIEVTLAGGVGGASLPSFGSEVDDARWVWYPHTRKAFRVLSYGIGAGVGGAPRAEGFQYWREPGSRSRF